MLQSIFYLSFVVCHPSSETLDMPPRTKHCTTLVAEISGVSWCSTPTHQHQLVPRYHSFFSRALCRKMPSAALSPFKVLRFFVIDSPPVENRRSDAADGPCTARYLRAKLATVGNVLCFSAHPLQLAAEGFHADLLLVLKNGPFVHGGVLDLKSACSLTCAGGGRGVFAYPYVLLHQAVWFVSMHERHYF